MRPHYRRNTAPSYVSHYCQAEIAALFSKLSSSATLTYDKNGVSAYEVDGRHADERLTVIHDGRNVREVFNIDFDALDNEPQAIRTFLLERGSLSAEPYYVSTPDNEVHTILVSVSNIDASIGKIMFENVQSAYINEPELRDKMSNVARLTPVIESWVKDNKQLLVYDGTDQSDARWKLKTFIASYLNVFMLNDTLMLTHSGSALVFACREEASGVAWYCADSFAGYEREKALGDIKADEHDELLDQNGLEYLSLKHIFIPENMIAVTVAGELLPVSPKTDPLQLYVTAIAEDLNLLEQVGNSPVL